MTLIRRRFLLMPLFLLGAVAVPSALAHVTLQPRGPLAPGRYATVLLVVPTERHVPTTQVSLEVPDAFLNAGGRLSRVQPPSGWQVEIVKEDKPSDVYEQEMKERSERESQSSQGAEHAASGSTAAATPPADTQPGAASEEELMNEMRKKWIKKIVFTGGSIPPDFFQEFSLSLQLPNEPGEYRFAALQTYADGTEVSWSELIEEAEHPAATISIPPPQRNRWPLHIGAIVAAVLIAFWAGTRMRGRTA